jgi:hypothetical protein
MHEGGLEMGINPNVDGDDELFLIEVHLENL